MLKTTLFAASLVLATSAIAETISNKSIIALSETGIGDEAIIAKIEASDVQFDLSTSQMIALKKRGISGPVIAAMIAADRRSKGLQPVSRPPETTRVAPGASRPDNPAALLSGRAAGIYLISGGKPVRIEFNVSSQMKTGGILGMAMTAGIAAASVKAVIQGERARVVLPEASPTFYFHFPNGGAQAQSSFEATTMAPTSPNEFSLVRMKAKKGVREVRIGRVNIAGAQTGVMDKERVDFTYDEIRPGLYAVKPTAPLTPGEYGFVMVGSGGARLARIFDFSVQ